MNDAVHEISENTGAGCEDVPLGVEGPHLPVGSKQVVLESTG